MSPTEAAAVRIELAPTGVGRLRRAGVAATVRVELAAFLGVRRLRRAGIAAAVGVDVTAFL